MNAVSYTHLDVYKRQSAASFPAYCRPDRTAVWMDMISIRKRRLTTAKKKMGTAAAASRVMLPLKEVKADALPADV